MPKRRPGSETQPGSQPGSQPGAFSALKEPVGPKGRNVYARRRIIVLLGLLAVAVAVALMIIRPGSSSGSVDDVQKVEVPSDLTEQPEQPADTAAETAACEPSQLLVNAVTDQGSYGPDELPQFALSVKNTGKDACIADLGTAGMTFTVTSGADQVWRSTDCQSASDNLPVILEAGEQLASESLPWDRTRSSTETCEITRDPVVSGGASYHLSVTAGGASNKDTAQFLLY